MAAPTTYLTVIKRMSYRGDPSEEWSNSYALTGSTPVDSAAWRTLFDALVLQEKTCYTSDVTVVAGYGYAGIPGSGDHSIWNVDMTLAPNTPVPGTLTGTGAKMAGDQAGWLRWGLDRFTAKGKRVYLRKYFHGGYTSSGTYDDMHTGTRNAYLAFGLKLEDGSFAAGRKICDKDGNVPIGHAASTYITVRTLKRRGKRPPTGP
jgi:hypothetical protein